MQLRGLFRIYGLVLGCLLLTLSLQFVMIYFMEPRLQEYIFWPPAPLPGIPLIFLLALIAFCAGALLILSLLQQRLRPQHYAPRTRRAPPPRWVSPRGPAATGVHHRPPYPGYYRHRSGPAYYHRPEDEESSDGGAAAVAWGGPASPGGAAATPPAEPFPPRAPPMMPPSPPRPLVAEAVGLEIPRPRWLLLGFLASLAVGVATLKGPAAWVWFFPIAFVVAFSFPSLMWLNYVYLRSDTPEPQRPVLLALTWGMLATLPASLLNTGAAVALGVDLEALLEGGAIGTPEVLLVAGVAPLVEEFLKPLGLLLLLKRLRTPYEGVLYGVACGMGFALIENLQYELIIIWTKGTEAWTINTFARGVGSTVLHAVGPATVGYALAVARQSRGYVPRLAGAYGLGVLMHSAWNGTATLPLVFHEQSEWELYSLGLLVLLVLLCAGLLWSLLQMGLTHAAVAQASPTRPGATGPSGRSAWSGPPGAPVPPGLSGAPDRWGPPGSPETPPPPDPPQSSKMPTYSYPPGPPAAEEGLVYTWTGWRPWKPPGRKEAKTASGEGVENGREEEAAVAGEPPEASPAGAPPTDPQAQADEGEAAETKDAPPAANDRAR